MTIDLFAFATQTARDEFQPDDLALAVQLEAEDEARRIRDQHDAIVTAHIRQWFRTTDPVDDGAA